MKNENQNHWNVQDGYNRTWKPGIGFEDILKMIKRRKNGIIVLLLVSLIGATIYHYIQQPEYHAVAMIMINDAKDPANFPEAVIGYSKAVDNKDSKKDAELLKSISIAQLTIKELKKNSTNQSLELLGKRHFSSPITNFINEYLPIQILNAGQNQKINKNPKELLAHQALELSKRIRVELVRETNMLKVSVASPFPDEAALLTNTLCQVYKENNISIHSEKYSQANSFIANMLHEQQIKLREADSVLSKYMKAHEIYEVSGNTQHLLDMLIDAEAKNKAIASELHIAKNGLDFLEKKLSDTEKSLSSKIAQNVNSQLGSIMDEIRERESEYVKVLREKGSDNADVKAKRQQLDIVKTRYEQLSRSKIAGEIGYAGRTQKYNFDLISEKLQIEKKMNDLNFSSIEFSRLKQYYENQLSALPQKQQEFLRLQRDRDAVSKTYIALKEKLDETRVLIGSEAGQVSIIGAAFQPFFPEKPFDLRKSLILGMLFGGSLAIAYTYIAESLDSSIKEESFIKNAGLQTLAIIPFVAQDDDKESSCQKAWFKRMFRNTAGSFNTQYSLHGKIDSVSDMESAIPMIAAERDNSLFAESFRTLRTSLDVFFFDRPLHSLLVSGTAMSEGKSTVCTNLGIAYALNGKKTLIIDCDLRRASQHKKFNCTKNPGLTDYLVGENNTLPAFLIQPTHIQNLFVLCTGGTASNPNELLGSEKMQNLIKALSVQFDKVLIDCPPLFLSDAAQLVLSVDGILLVSRLGYTSKKSVSELADDIFFHPRIIGSAVIASRNSGPIGYGRLGNGKYTALV
jgi:polysaccharide biosynthesis transport protein